MKRIYFVLAVIVMMFFQIAVAHAVTGKLDGWEDRVVLAEAGAANSGHSVADARIEATWPRIPPSPR